MQLHLIPSSNINYSKHPLKKHGLGMFSRGIETLLGLGILTTIQSSFVFVLLKTHLGPASRPGREYLTPLAMAIVHRCP